MQRRAKIERRFQDIQDNIKQAAEHTLHAAVAVTEMYITATEDEGNTAERIRRKLRQLPESLEHDPLMQSIIYFEETAKTMTTDRQTHYLFEPENLAELDIETLLSMQTQIQLAIARKFNALSSK